MKNNNLSEVKKHGSNTTAALVKLYPHGKIGLLFGGPKEYQVIAEECFKRALDVRITLDDIAFVQAMRDRGTPDKAINELLKSCSVFDEVHLGGLN